MDTIKINQGSEVTINCPSAQKYPAFHGAFHGLNGRVVAVEPKGADGIVIVDVSNISKGEAGVWINVDRSWLSHANSRRA